MTRFLGAALISAVAQSTKSRQSLKLCRPFFVKNNIIFLSHLLNVPNRPLFSIKDTVFSVFSSLLLHLISPSIQQLVTPDVFVAFSNMRTQNNLQAYTVDYSYMILGYHIGDYEAF